MPIRSSPVTTLFPLLLVGLLAGMTYWLDLATRPRSPDNDGKSRHDPDYIVERFEVRRHDPDGALQHTLVADLMRHYPDDDSTVVLAPRLTYHRAPPTHVSAREARLDSKGKHVELIDDVRVVRASRDDAPDTVLTTTRLDAWPDDEIARSDMPVTITRGQTRVEGSRLEADNKTETYVLDGPVRGVFFRNDGTATQTQPTAAKPPAKPKTRTKPRPTPPSKT